MKINDIRGQTRNSKLLPLIKNQRIAIKEQKHTQLDANVSPAAFPPQTYTHTQSTAASH